MAHKLGKCRLCLKLGDFCSIFTIDNQLQLAEMVMKCAQVQIYEGDGLPDKVCSECIQKLSGAYIFKLQCERINEELRINYVPPPGFSTPPSNNRHRNGSFSNHTKMPRDQTHSDDTISMQGRSSSVTSTNSQKPSQLQSKNAQENHDTSAPNERQTVSNDCLTKSFECLICLQKFQNPKNLAIHTTLKHKKKPNNTCKKDSIVEEANKNKLPKDEENLTCKYCGKTFKLKIMLKRHYALCDNAMGKSEKKKPFISPETQSATEPAANKKVQVPCLFCNQLFDDFRLHREHFDACPKFDEFKIYVCHVCNKSIRRKQSYLLHIETAHLETNYQQCQFCSLMLPSQNDLIQHLTAHVSEQRKSGGIASASANKTADSSVETGTSLSKDDLSCVTSSKDINDTKQGHAELPAHSNVTPDIPSTSQLDEELISSDVESHHVEDSYGCDICERRFDSKAAICQHKIRAHGIYSGNKYCKVKLYDSVVRCLICDFEMQMNNIDHHNAMHIANDTQPKFLYICSGCGSKFKSFNALAKHIASVHKIKTVKASTKLSNCENLMEANSSARNQRQKIKQNQLQNNTEDSNNQGDFVCNKCSKCLPNLLTLKRHLNWHATLEILIQKRKAFHE